MISTVTHPRLGEVTLSRTRRARRISISVRGTGAVRVSFPYGVSVRRAMQFLDLKADWVEQARVRMAARMPAEPPLPPAEAKAHLPARIERLSQLTGLKYAKLTIRASRTKWGSCSGRNTISLSLFLMTLPEHLRDYVIVHELCHTVHHNHSPRFHALVDRMVGGNEKALNRELRAFAIR